MKTVILSLMLTATLAAQVASHAPTVKVPAPRTPATAPARPVVRVNGAVLNDRDLAREMMNVFPYARQHGGKIPAEFESDIRKAAIHNLEFEELAYQEAQRRGMTVSPSRIERGIKDFRTQYDSEAQFKQYLKSEQKGSVEELKNKIRRAMLVDEILKLEVDNRSVYSEAQLKQFYEKNPDRFRKPESVSIQTITIAYGDKPSPADKQAARKRAEDALIEARKTKDYNGFGELAEKVSMDDWHVMMGDHKWLHRGRMPVSVEKIVFGMKVDEVSGVIDTGDSFCIVRLNGREDSHLVAFAEVKPQLKQDLEKQKRDELRAAFDKRLRAGARIEEL